MISATIPSKRKRIPKQFFEAPAAAAAPPAAAPPAAKKGGRMKTKAAGPRGAPQSKVKTKAVSRIGLAPPPSSKATAPPPSVPSDATPAPPPPTMDVDKVFDVESTTSYMDMLNESTVDLDAGIDAFDGEGNVEEIDDEEEDEGDEEVVEVDPAAVGSSSTPKPRTANYSEIEDAILVRPCLLLSILCVDDVQTSHNIVVVQPKYAQQRYKDIAGSKNKEFQFQHCFSIPQHLPKWKLRDSEPKCKKEALLTMDDEATDAHMCGDHLRRLVYRGQWADALDYLGRFNSRKTVASNALHFFLHTLWALANVAAGATDGSVKSTAHQHGMALSMLICRCARLRSIVKAMVDSSQQCASLDWESTRVMAASLAYYLADEDPELYRLIQLPDHGQMLPLLPISLQSSSQHTPAFMDESLDRVAGLVEECLNAGKRQKLQSSGRVPRFLIPLQIAPRAPPVSQTNSGTTSVPNAGAPASSQIMSGAFTSLAKNSGMSSEQNSGESFCAFYKPG
ncbi:hypothetical protein ACQ4PT_017676 [Festuca glaucescens]